MCESLKIDERTSHVPVPLLTSRSSTESKREGFNAGADNYVTKSFNRAFLFSRIGNLIHDRRRLQAKYSRVLTVEPIGGLPELAEETFLRKVTTRTTSSTPSKKSLASHRASGHQHRFSKHKKDTNCVERVPYPASTQFPADSNKSVPL